MSAETDTEKVLTGDEAISNIFTNYGNLEKSIIAQLNMLHKNHGTTIGTLRESIWKEMFERIIPKKFVIIQSVFIIDSQANLSREVDLAIIDEMYTPYIFQYGQVKFVPIEAVAVVVECKSSKQKVKKLEEWSAAIEKLTTNANSIARIATGILNGAAPTQPATRPIKIICNMNTSNQEQLLELFDFVISVNKEKITINYSRESLWEWYTVLNLYKKDVEEHLNMQFKYRAEKQAKSNKINNEAQTEKEVADELEKIKDGYMRKLTHRKNDKGKLEAFDLDSYKIEGHSLLSLNFQLNQLLMLINNPMPFPHLAYVKMFSEKNPNNSKKEESANE